VFLIGAAAICGLPPLNGFFGEFLLYYGSFAAILSDGVPMAVPTITAIAALALIGGLALAAFTKVFGIVFLGQARTAEAANAKEAHSEMIVGMWIPAGLCIAVGIAAPLLLPAIVRIVLQITPAVSGDINTAVSIANTILWPVVISSLSLAVLVAVIVIFRRRLLRDRTVAQSVTWDCGYAAPTSRIQYTASSFSQPIVSMFRDILAWRLKTKQITELFPQQAQFESHTPDISSEYIYRPVFKWIDKFMGKMRWVQYGIVQVYVLYIAITLLILLMWKLK
jgi:NADH:ubiquinone oxidoreductase subunit 5 (subunit L)/multisubunit Na+/H+ antiporter MnhA subunit